MPLALTRGIPHDMMKHTDAISVHKVAFGKLGAAVKPPSLQSMCDMVGYSKSEKKQDWIVLCTAWGMVSLLQVCQYHISKKAIYAGPSMSRPMAGLHAPLQQ